MNSKVKIKVRLFAVLREEIGSHELNLEFPQGAVCREVVGYLKNNFPSLDSLLERSLLAINGVYANPCSDIFEGDEVAVLPPVSGG